MKTFAETITGYNHATALDACKDWEIPVGVTMGEKLLRMPAEGNGGRWCRLPVERHPRETPTDEVSRRAKNGEQNL